jgi:hypothetical protein
MSADRADSEGNLRSSSYFILRVAWYCRHCGESTHAHALALPETHEILQLDDAVQPGARPQDSWECAAITAVIFYVGYIGESVRRHLSQHLPHYARDLDEMTGSSYFMNHCDRCGAKQPDHELHEEYPAAFGSRRSGQAFEVRLIEVPEPFEAHAGGYTIEPAFHVFKRGFD